MATISELELEVQKIKQRNERVELDKKWETSYFRRVSIAIGTYIFCLIFLLLINAQNPFLVATVPSIGYLVSTLSLNSLKNFWLNQSR